MRKQLLRSLYRPCDMVIYYPVNRENFLAFQLRKQNKTQKKNQIKLKQLRQKLEKNH